ncbi:MAG TPA: hypothetical protein VFM29_10330 [Vicinamibacteria bacterium]|nr:hypothetical protein [Vicinamibacteria bacterium]
MAPDVRSSVRVNESRRAFWNSLPAALFSTGWLFLVPYLAPYLLFRVAGWPAPALVWVFRGLHVVTALLFLRFAAARIRGAHAADVLFWTGMAVLFFAPGAYLEFPADPWEHARRIFAWAGAVELDVAEHYADRFMYFWASTLLEHVPLEMRRPALAAYGGVWQLLLASAFHRFALRLGATEPWARVHVLATVFLFGNSAMGFYRHYALAPTVPAYVAYLGALTASIDLLERGERRQLPVILLAVVFIVFNHRQELLLLLISWVAVAAWVGARAAPSRSLGALALALLAIGCLSGTFLPGLLAASGARFSRWGSLPLWDLPYRDTLGLHGWIGLACAVVLLRRASLLACLTLAPSALLVFPPSAAALIAVLGDRPVLAFRALFAFPTSFALVEVLRRALAAVRPSWGHSRSPAPALAVALLIPMALRPESPVRGRLFFALHQPPRGLSLENLDAGIDWLATHRPGLRRNRAVVFGDPVTVGRYWRTRSPAGACVVLSDQATATLAPILLDGGIFANRRILPSALATVGAGGRLAGLMQQAPVCALLVPEPRPDQLPAPSVIAALVGHWPPDQVRTVLDTPAADREALRSLEGRGWKRTAVPPFYALYERVADPRTSEPASASSTEPWRAVR